MLFVLEVIKMRRIQVKGLLAQSVEHRTFNPLVVSSILTQPTIPKCLNLDSQDFKDSQDFIKATPKQKIK